MASPRSLALRIPIRLALLALVVPVPGAAQSSAATPPTADSVAPRPDSARAADTARAPRGGPPSNDTVAPPPPPMDSALAAACIASPGSRPDLMVVRFQSSATDRERAAVAREVGGKLVGRSLHTAPGAWLLHVPGSGADPSVADRLIMLAPVMEVSGTRCPRTPRPTR
jgi:hypothetical protein